MTPESQPSNMGMKINGHQCSHVNYTTKERCTSKDTANYSYTETGEGSSICLCKEHAHDHGFCWGCGGLLGGSEEFDMETSGLCEDCKFEADQADGELEDEDDEWGDDGL
jgi:hypothetical protein